VKTSHSVEVPRRGVRCFGCIDGRTSRKSKSARTHPSSVRFSLGDRWFTIGLPSWPMPLARSRCECFAKRNLRRFGRHVEKSVAISLDQELARAASHSASISTGIWVESLVVQIVRR